MSTKKLSKQAGITARTPMRVRLKGGGFMMFLVGSAKRFNEMDELRQIEGNIFPCGFAKRGALLCRTKESSARWFLAFKVIILASALPVVSNSGFMRQKTIFPQWMPAPRIALAYGRSPLKLFWSLVEAHTCNRQKLCRLLS
jgi:hypothetical protein